MAHRLAVDDERLKGRRCGIDNCPSNRYFRADGRIVCDRGHEQVQISQNLNLQIAEFPGDCG